MRDEELKTKRQGKYCWNCGVPLNYEHYIQTNHNESEDFLEKIWRNSFVQILCCSCYNKEIPPLTPDQIEIKRFIEKKIGKMHFSFYFSPVNNDRFKKVFHQTIPFNETNFIIYKGMNKIELHFREAHQYKEVSLSVFSKFLDTRYSRKQYSIILDIIEENNDIQIEVPKNLAPAIFHCTFHDFRALLAPYEEDA